MAASCRGVAYRDKKSFMKIFSEMADQNNLAVMFTEGPSTEIPKMNLICRKTWLPLGRGRGDLLQLRKL